MTAEWGERDARGVLHHLRQHLALDAGQVLGLPVVAPAAGLGRVEQALLRDVGAPLQDVADRLSERLDRRELFLRLRDIPDVAREKHHDGLPVDVLVEPRGRRCNPHRGHQGQLRRRFRRSLAEHLEDPGGVVSPPRDGASKDLGADRVEHVLHARQHAEVPPSSAEAPEEIGVLLLAGVHEPAVGSHEVHRPDVVARPPEPSRDVPEAAAQGQPGDAGGGDEPENGGQAVELRFPVHVTEEAARLRPGNAGPRVHPHPAHQGEVEHQAPFSHRQTRDVVTAPLDGQRDSALPGEAARRRPRRRSRGTGRRARDGGRSSRSRRMRASS